MFSKKMVLLLSVLFSMFLFNGFAEAKVEDPEKGQQGQGNIPVSRGEFIKRIVDETNIPLSLSDDETPFKDVKDDDISYINTAIKEEIILPEEYPSKFYPHKPITRLEGAIFLARALDLGDSKNSNQQDLYEAVIESGIMNDSNPSDKFITYTELSNIVTQVLAYMGYQDIHIELSGKVKEVPVHLLQNLVSINDDGTIVFLKDKSLNELKEGDILSIPPLDEFQQGLSLKITEIKEMNDRVIFKTKEPLLEEVIKELDMDSTIEISQKQITPADGVEVSYQEEEPIHSISSLSIGSQMELGNGIIFKFNKQLVEQNDEGSSEPLASASFSGELVLSAPKLNVSANIENFRLKKGQVVLEANQHANVKLDGTVSVEDEMSIPLAEIKFPIANGFSGS